MIGTVVFILIFLAIGLSVVLIAMRSGRPPAGSHRESRATARAWGAGLGIVIVLVGLGLPALVLATNSHDHARKANGVKLTAAETHGRELFGTTCATCHTLAASHAVGRVGPNLDDLLSGVQNSKAFVADAIKNGRAKGNGNMPAGLFTGPDADDVAAYVAAVAGH